MPNIAGFILLSVRFCGVPFKQAGLCPSGQLNYIMNQFDPHEAYFKVNLEIAFTLELL